MIAGSASTTIVVIRDRRPTSFTPTTPPE
jgi:hypothetical protein